MSNFNEQIRGEVELLRKMYECQEEMGKLLDGGTEDPDYIIMSQLIDRLEKFIIDDTQNLI